MNNLKSVNESNLSRKKACTDSDKTPIFEGKYTEEVEEPLKAPEPTATGDEKIAIVKHSFYGTRMNNRGSVEPASVELAIRNISASVIATVLFEAAFYDSEGNVIDTVRHIEIEMEPSKSRAIHINSSVREHNKVKSYNIKVLRATTASIEKVQLRQHKIRTTETREEEVEGAVKNLSDARADAILVATFYDTKNEIISTKAIIIRDIEPDGMKHFHFKFRPQEGDLVKTYNLRVICDIEE